MPVLNDDGTLAPTNAVQATVLDFIVDRAEYVPYIVLGSFVVAAILIYLNGRNYYHPTKEDVINLMQGVIDGKAHWNSWASFTEIRVKDNPEVERIRQRCMELDKYWAPSKTSLLTEEGILKLKEILDEVKKGNV